MPALVFLVLVGLFAHSVFIPAGPVSKPETPQPKIVVINTAGQVVDTWQQNTKGEIVVEVPDVVVEEIVEAEPVDVSSENLEETGDEEESADDSDSMGDENTEEEQSDEEDVSEEEGGQDEESVDEEGTDPVEEEEVIEEIFEAPPIVEDPVLVIEEETDEEIVPEVLEQNLVEVLISE